MTWKILTSAISISLAALFSLGVKNLVDRSGRNPSFGAPPVTTSIYLGNSFKADRWNDLVLGESRPPDALRVLGKPKAENIGNLSVMGIQKELAPRHKEKVFRLLQYENPVGDQTVSHVELAFLKDRLVSIMLRFKESDSLKTEDLTSTYGDVFGAFDTASGEPLNSQDLPTTHSLAARAKTSYISALVQRPDTVRAVQLISREFETR